MTTVLDTCESRVDISKGKKKKRERGKEKVLQKSPPFGNSSKSHGSALKWGYLFQQYFECYSVENLLFLFPKLWKTPAFTRLGLPLHLQYCTIRIWCCCSAADRVRVASIP